MNSGTLIQLVANGDGESAYYTQDSSGEAMFSKGRDVFNHTPFLLDVREYRLPLLSGNVVNFEVPLDGHLLKSVSLVVLPPPGGWTDNYHQNQYPVENYIEWCEVWFGDQLVEHFSSLWYKTMCSFLYPPAKTNGITRMATSKYGPRYVPIPFFFTYNQQPLPIISMTNTTVQLRFSVPKSMLAVSHVVRMVADFVVLGDQECRLFAQTRFAQTTVLVKEFTFAKVYSDRTRIRLEGPVTDLFVTFTDSSGVAVDAVDTISLNTNGNVTCSLDSTGYSRLIKPWELYAGGGGNKAGYTTHVFAFALYPNKLFPSGTLNYNVVTDCYLEYTLKPIYEASLLRMNIVCRNRHRIVYMSGQSAVE